MLITSSESAFRTIKYFSFTVIYAALEFSGFDSLHCIQYDALVVALPTPAIVCSWSKVILMLAIV